jgi:hypothetical protein
MRKHALGIVVKDRWYLTQKTLQSLYHTDQIKDSYDLFIIDNGSDPIVSNDLKEWTQSAIVPVKNLIKTKSLPIAAAWNLFLSITTDYYFRTKLDNDLIFANTPVAAKPFERSERGLPHGAGPGDAGTNPGAPKVASFVVGAGVQVKNKTDKSHTCFLKHIEESMSESNLGVCAIPAIPVGRTLVDAMPVLGAMKWRDNPLLVGGCMGITKKTFEQLGYFDETLPCHIDWEYSQRAMGAGINVGYTQDYCVIHLGETNPTGTPSEVQKNDLTANMIGSQIGFKREFVPSKWEQVLPKIQKAITKSNIVNLT